MLPPYKVIGAALGCREAFQRWPPSDMTCLNETLAKCRLYMNYAMVT